jgi:hypothetical protein
MIIQTEEEEERKVRLSFTEKLKHNPFLPDHTTRTSQEYQAVIIFQRKDET